VLPSRKAKEEGIEEERRLLYGIIHRAQRSFRSLLPSPH
jgi:superfamily I DNA/RNA helicase